MARDEKLTKADEARRLLDNDAWDWSFTNARNSLISQLERIDFNGSDESEKHAVQGVMKLQALNLVKAQMVSAIHSYDREQDKQERKYPRRA